MSSRLQQELHSIRQQWQGNPRLRYALVSIPLIALLHLNLVLHDARSEQHQENRELQNALQDARQLAKQDHWLDYLQAAREHLDQQASQYFANAESEAYARADIQAAIQALLDQHRLEQIRIEVSSAGTPTPATGLVALQIQLSGNAKGKQLYSLLAAMESANPRFRIDSLNINTQADSHLVFNLIASVWFTPWSQP